MRNSEQEKNRPPLFWVTLNFERYEGAICHVFSFLFTLSRTSGKKEHLDENDFRHCYGNFFESAILESYLVATKFFLSNYETH